MKTSQEEFWENEFGDKYIDRNQSERLLSANISLFSKILNRTKNINSVIEYGANIGLNLKAINLLKPQCKLDAVEINSKAANILAEWGKAKVVVESIIDYKPSEKWDLVLTKTVLIHINPEKLDSVYKVLYDSSSRYICIAEYYNPHPVEIMYRGHSNKLFKRDFAGEMMDLYKDLNLVDYGFVYHRDANFWQDDITWFLLEKT